MIFGVHAIVYTEDAEQLRAFFRDVLELPWVDAHDGWLIFALPPTELAAHPADRAGRHELYLMCDDIENTMADLKSKAEKFFVTRVKRFEPDKMVACTLVFEGPRAQVEQQQRDLYRIAARHGGMKAGAENGRRGYQLTFIIAYIRDFLMNYYIIAESFETSVPWSHALSLCENVKRRLTDEYKRRGLPGKPFVTSRITQVYPTGVCIYFYFGFYYKGIPNPHEAYLELENIARDEILKSGGSLSHHHGVGKLRREFLPRIMSETALQWKRELKKTLDPTNVFGAGNQGLDMR